MQICPRARFALSHCLFVVRHLAAYCGMLRRKRRSAQRGAARHRTSCEWTFSLTLYTWDQDTQRLTAMVACLASTVQLFRRHWLISGGVSIHSFSRDVLVGTVSNDSAWLRTRPFYSARNARIASAVLATAIPSVRLSVRPSICPSHAGIVSKRRHVARCNVHRWIAKCV